MGPFGPYSGGIGDEVLRHRRDEKIFRRLVAVLDREFSFDFLGRHDMPPGTELVVGGEEGRAEIGDGGDLVFRVAPEYFVRIPFGSYHLETEEETWKVAIRTERWPTRVI